MRFKMPTVPLTISIGKTQVFSFALIVLVVGCLAQSMMTRAAEMPKTHPKKNKLLRGVVTGVRKVPAYAAVLAASTDPLGDIFCDDNHANYAMIKESSIFRVETGSRYFDLSKLCTKDKLAFDRYGRGVIHYTWPHWQRLYVHEPIIFLVVKMTVQLPIPRCQELGMLSKAQATLALNPSSKTGRTIYSSNCTYEVTEAYVMVKRSNVRLWTYRVVDSGPRSQAKSKQIGASYSASLPPPW